MILFGRVPPPRGWGVGARLFHVGWLWAGPVERSSRLDRAGIPRGCPAAPRVRWPLRLHGPASTSVAALAGSHFEPPLNPWLSAFAQLQDGRAASPTHPSARSCSTNLELPLRPSHPCTPQPIPANPPATNLPCRPEVASPHHPRNLTGRRPAPATHLRPARGATSPQSSPTPSNRFFPSRVSRSYPQSTPLSTGPPTSTAHCRCIAVRWTPGAGGRPLTRTTHTKPSSTPQTVDPGGLRPPVQRYGMPPTTAASYPQPPELSTGGLGTTNRSTRG